MASIAPNTVVTLTYNLSVADENQQQVLVETADSEAPMVFLYGVSGLPEEFESQLAGKQPGDKFSFDLTPEQGYGEYDPQAVVQLPKQVFEVDGQVDEQMLEPGNYLPMADNEGHQMQAKVVEVGDTEVTMDFNHPLAGMVMHFEGQVEAVRPATAEEQAHGHVHGEGGHNH